MASLPCSAVGADSLAGPLFLCGLSSSERLALASHSGGCVPLNVSEEAVKTWHLGSELWGHLCYILLSAVSPEFSQSKLKGCGNKCYFFMRRVAKSPCKRACLTRYKNYCGRLCTSPEVPPHSLCCILRGPFRSRDLTFFSSGTFKNIISLMISLLFFLEVLLFRCWICWINSLNCVISSLLSVSLSS